VPSGATATTGRRASSAVRFALRRLTLELDVALLRDRGLFNRDHLAFHLRELRGVLLIATDEKRCWPEDYDGRCGRPAVFCTLAVLHT
jgi:hypothetical protein